MTASKIAVLATVLTLALAGSAQAYTVAGYVSPGDSNMSCGEARLIDVYAWRAFGLGDALNVQCISKPSASSYRVRHGDLSGAGAGMWDCLVDYDATGTHARSSFVGCNRR